MNPQGIAPDGFLDRAATSYGLFFHLWHRLSESNTHERVWKPSCYHYIKPMYNANRRISWRGSDPLREIVCTRLCFPLRLQNGSYPARANVDITNRTSLVIVPGVEPGNSTVKGWWL